MNGSKKPSRSVGLTVLVCSLLLAACSGPKETPLPRDLDKMEAIRPALEKLTPEERELATGYIMRHTIGAKLGAVFGGKESPGIPEGMTLGKAIEEQRRFRADAVLEEAKQQALKAKLQAEREAAIKPMREAVTVALVSKKINTERGYSGMVMDEYLEVTFGYKNNSPKDIAGVKGRVSVKDLFGDEISAFRISNDSTIKTGQTATWTGSRSLRFSLGTNKDRKLAELTDDKFSVEWEPQVIVFADGTKLSVPEN